jgi:sn-glycerol 3-phosphate transport system substrate-binding protein
VAQKGYFVYGGRKNEPEAKFYSGECAMMTTSSAAYGTIKANAKFRFAESTLPYYADVAGAPQNTIIGGASLWVMGGKSKAEYKGVAKFFTFLSQPDVQAAFSQETGYLPITMAAYELTKKSGFYEKEPGHRRGGAADDRQDDEQLARRPRGQPAADPRRDGRGARGRVGGQEDAAAGARRSRARGNEIIDRFNKANRQ